MSRSKSDWKFIMYPNNQQTLSRTAKRRRPDFADSSRLATSQAWNYMEAYSVQESVWRAPLSKTKQSIPCPPNHSSGPRTLRSFFSNIQLPYLSTMIPPRTVVLYGEDHPAN